MSVPRLTRPVLDKTGGEDSNGNGFLQRGGGYFPHRRARQSVSRLGQHRAGCNSSCLCRRHEAAADRDDGAGNGDARESGYRSVGGQDQSAVHVQHGRRRISRR
jgi:hypothetical protein